MILKTVYKDMPILVVLISFLFMSCTKIDPTVSLVPNYTEVPKTETSPITPEENEPPNEEETTPEDSDPIILPSIELSETNFQAFNVSEILYIEGTCTGDKILIANSPGNWVSVETYPNSEVRCKTDNYFKILIPAYSVFYTSAASYGLKAVNDSGEESAEAYFIILNKMN